MIMIKFTRYGDTGKATRAVLTRHNVTHPERKHGVVRVLHLYGVRLLAEGGHVIERPVR